MEKCKFETCQNLLSQTTEEEFCVVHRRTLEARLNEERIIFVNDRKFLIKNNGVVGEILNMKIAPINSYTAQMLQSKNISLHYAIRRMFL